MVGLLSRCQEFSCALFMRQDHMLVSSESIFRQTSLLAAKKVSVLTSNAYACNG